MPKYVFAVTQMNKALKTLLLGLLYMNINNMSVYFACMYRIIVEFESLQFCVVGLLTSLCSFVLFSHYYSSFFICSFFIVSIFRIAFCGCICIVYLNLYNMRKLKIVL